MTSILSGEEQLSNVDLNVEESPAREAARLEAVRRYDVIDLPPAGTFEDVVEIAAEVFGVPIAIVSIVDEDEIFFPARLGVDFTHVARKPGLCGSAVMHDVPTVIPDTRLDAVAMSHPLVAGEVGLRFYAGAPLRTSDGHNLGTVCVLDREPRQPTPGQIAVLERLAGLVMQELELRRAARGLVALEAELRVRVDEERDQVIELAVTLQRVLLPPELPIIPGLDLVALYRPADRAVVGGDFYDVFPLRRGTWGFAIGDVCGKGPLAATIATAARHGIRVAAAEHRRPSDVLRAVNDSLVLTAGERGSGASFCTAVYGTIRRASGGYEMSVACGGHPLPIIVRANGTLVDLGVPGTLLGVFPEIRLTDQRALLAPGDSFVMFSDGLSESLCGDKMLNREGVFELLRNARGWTAGQIVDRLDPANHGTRPRDDLAIIAARVTQ